MSLGHGAISELAISEIQALSSGGSATLNGQTVTVTTSIPTVGTLSAGSTLNGQTVTATASIPTPGTLSAGADLAGQVVTATASVPTPGTLSAGSTLNGQTVTVTASIPTPGTLSAGSTLAGQIVTITASIPTPGTLSADSGATLNGQLVTATVSIPSPGLLSSDSAGPQPAGSFGSSRKRRVRYEIDGKFYEGESLAEIRDELAQVAKRKANRLAKRARKNVDVPQPNVPDFAVYEALDDGGYTKLPQSSAFYASFVQMFVDAFNDRLRLIREQEDEDELEMILMAIL